MRRFGWLLWLVVLLVAHAAMGPRLARAEEPRRAGTVRLDAGGKGRIELHPAAGDTLAGEVAIVNDGREPLVVSRLAVRGGPIDDRAARVTARLVEGTLPVTILPGQSRRALVTWQPDRSTRVRQLLAHLVVTSSDESTGEVSIGIRGEITT